jgi:hypothetical protein
MLWRVGRLRVIGGDSYRGDGDEKGLRARENARI